MKPPWAALPLNSEQHTCHWTVNLVVFWYFLSYSELCHVIFLYVVVPSYPQFQLSLVSVTQGQPQSENIKWTILEIIHKFYIACQSEHDEISSCLLCPVQDGNQLGLAVQPSQEGPPPTTFTGQKQMLLRTGREEVR